MSRQRLVWRRRHAQFRALTIVIYYDGDSQPDSVSSDHVMLVADTDVLHRASPQVGGGFPASASLPDLAKAQEQEIAALVRQLQDANARIRALENEAARIRDDEAVTGKANEQLRTALRELDETKRESAVKVKVRRTLVPRLRLLTGNLLPSVCVRLAYVVMSSHEKTDERTNSLSQVRLHGVIESVRLELQCPICLHEIVTLW